MQRFRFIFPENLFSGASRILLTFSFFIFHFALSEAQCPFTPTVTGEFLVCPEGRTTLGTQTYDAYQWYTRPFGASTPMPVPGATGQFYTVQYNDTPVYVSVEATLNNCTERSAEVLVDGLVFLPLVVQSTGQFTVGPNGEAVICAGDTMYLIALQPYTINHQWYDGNTPIAGANDDTLIVTQPGLYWLTASPEPCPELTVSLGVIIETVWSDVPGCVPSSVREPRRIHAVLAPNPAGDYVELTAAETGPVEFVLSDMTGRPLRRQVFAGHTVVSLAGLPGGIYVAHLRTGDGAVAHLKFSKI